MSCEKVNTANVFTEIKGFKTSGNICKTKKFLKIKLKRAMKMTTPTK